MKYIKDDSKVRMCTSNISKMNVFEHIYYAIFHWNFLGKSIADFYKSFIGLLNSAVGLMVSAFAILFFPILIIIYSILSIKSNKEHVKRFK